MEFFLVLLNGLENQSRDFKMMNIEYFFDVNVIVIDIDIQILNLFFRIYLTFQIQV